MNQTIGAYKKEFEPFGCFNPECQSGSNLEVHHIIPLSKGGENDSENYIILCQKCHRGLKNHSNWRKKSTTLWTYKFYFESKWRNQDDSMPSMPDSYPQSEDDKGKNCAEILQSEMPSNISQSSKNQKKNEGIPKRFEQTPKRISTVGIRKCWWCGTEFNAIQRRSWCCSDICKKAFKDDPQNSFYHRDARKIQAEREIQRDISNLQRTCDSLYAIAKLQDPEKKEKLRKAKEVLSQALSALKELEK